MGYKLGIVIGVGHGLFIHIGLLLFASELLSRNIFSPPYMRPHIFSPFFNKDV